jgi:CheY-like chemotaxis protein
MNVLVIEDNHSDFQMMRNLCEQLPDCSIFVSHQDLEDGLQCLAGGGIDAVFLGLPFLGHDSLAVLQQVHQQARTAPVIVITSTVNEILLVCSKMAHKMYFSGMSSPLNF